MAFWSSWQLWEKLTLVLAALIVTVFIYATCVFLYHRWKTQRCAAVEIEDKGVEIFPMLKRDEIPFGVKALEQGLQVEGVWISYSNTPIPSPVQTSTPARSRSSSPAPKYFPVRPPSLGSSMALESGAGSPASLPSTQPVTHSEADVVAAHNYTYENLRPGGTYTPLMRASSPNLPSTLNRRSDIYPNNEKRVSFHTRLRRASHLFDGKSTKTDFNDQDQSALGSMRVEKSPQPSFEGHRASRITILRRRSSEEFRRRMSQIFNERIHMNTPTDRLQLDSALRETQRQPARRSILEAFRS